MPSPSDFDAETDFRKPILRNVEEIRRTPGNAGQKGKDRERL
jgi:hypothetical protein